MTREEAIRLLTQDYCCNRAVCELYSQNLCQTENCEIWVAKKALEEPERKYGRWIDITNDESLDIELKCSECGFELINWLKMHYCPNCGARMDGD